MSEIRRYLTRLPGLAALVVAAALLLRIVTPAGFMPMDVGGRVVVSVCTGHGPVTAAMGEGTAKHGSTDSGAAMSPCAFADLSLPAIGGAGPVLLAQAIGHVLALGFLVLRVLPIAEPAQLRPPLRGPPAAA